MSSKDTIEIDIDGQVTKIRRFKLKWLKKNPTIAVIAKRGSGKSYVCRDLLRHLNKDHGIPGGVIISKTEKMNPFYSEFFADSFIHSDFAEILARIFDRQDVMLEKQKDKAKEGKKVDPRMYLLMDDCLADRDKWIKDNHISTLFLNGRHHAITFILTMQFPLGIPPDFRSNFDYVFLLAEDQNTNVKRIYDHYAGIFPTYECFRTIFPRITEDYRSLVLINTKGSAKFTDKVFWYKASTDPIPSMGCSQFTRFHKDNYDTEWRKKKRSIDISQIFSRRQNNPRNVKVRAPEKKKEVKRETRKEETEGYAEDYPKGYAKEYPRSYHPPPYASKYPPAYPYRYRG